MNKNDYTIRLEEKKDYCKWCYADGTYTYSDMDELIEVCVRNMVNEKFTEEQARTYLKETLPKLDYWKRYEELGDGGKFDEFKKGLIEEINAFHIDGMPKLERLGAPFCQDFGTDWWSFHDILDGSPGMEGFW